MGAYGFRSQRGLEVYGFRRSGFAVWAWSLGFFEVLQGFYKGSIRLGLKLLC